MSGGEFGRFRNCRGNPPRSKWRIDIKMTDDFEFDVEMVRKAIQASVLAQRMRQQRWGAQGAPINTVVQGHRMVAAYNELLTIRPDATYHDFLTLYLRQIFGQKWWEDEETKTAEQRHILVNWNHACERMMLEGSTGEHKVHEAPMPAEAAHLLRLAFDLHQIRHLGLLLPSLVKRLKVIDQFQGARYEAAVSAAFARANFHIELEPEGKGPQKRCEFVAMHLPTKRKYTVEAKSRHLPGILDQPNMVPSARNEPFVEALIRKALDKTAEYDRIICIDINCPHPSDNIIPEWGSTLRQQVNKLEQKGSGPAILIFTNAPFHFLKPGSPVRGQKSMLMGLLEPRFQPQDVHHVQQTFPGIIDAANAFHLPIPSGWD